MSTALQSLFAYILVFGIACGIYSNSLNGPFLYDDSCTIIDNMDLRPETPLEMLLEHDFWGQVNMFLL